MKIYMLNHNDNNMALIWECPFHEGMNCICYNFSVIYYSYRRIELVMRFQEAHILVNMP